MRVAGEALVEVLHVLVQHGVAGDVVREGLELQRRSEISIAFSPSLPTMMGSSISLPSILRMATAGAFPFLGVSFESGWEGLARVFMPVFSQ
jgi:hypothetical protein